VKLKKALYGLKDSPRLWNSAFSSFLKSLGYESYMLQPCFFFKRVKGVIVSLLSQRNIDDVTAELILPPRWVDGNMTILTSLTLRSLFYILEQNSGLFLKMHLQMLLYFPEFTFENDLFFCHCNFGSPVGINKRMNPISLNHYGAVRLI
jgi:hypothetical protein